jgi:hypothetical protein
MKADLRISVKDYPRNKNLKVTLSRVPVDGARQYWVRVNGASWPKEGRAVSLSGFSRRCARRWSNQCDRAIPSFRNAFRNVGKVSADFVGGFRNV